MNSFKVFNFFCFVLLFALVSCFDNVISNEIETETTVLGNRIIPFEGRDEGDIISSDEESGHSSLDRLVPGITLDQYRLSANIYVLMFVIFNLPDRYECNVKIILSLILFYTAISYFRPRYIDPSHNIPTISPDRWLLTPISWTTEVCLLSEDQCSDGLLYYKKPVLGLIFLLQLVYYFKAFLKH